MKCFIASAFGRDDVDRIYDHGIKPVLSALRISPVRVDRHEHNDDIDDKILDLMSEADFGIVDLSYARPSAYFEAGHMLGNGKPVIFIARADHFKDKDDDPEGTRVIHFDLKMKNVIAWTEANDAFRSRLRKRLGIVIRPIITAAERNALHADERNQFARMSHVGQASKINDCAARLLREAGFRPEDHEYSGNNKVHRWIKNKNRRRQILVLMNQLRFKKSDLPYFSYYSIPMTTKEESVALKDIDMIFVVASVNPISKQSFRSYFRSYEELPSGSLRRGPHETERGSIRTSPTSTTICFVDKISSQSDFETRLSKVLAEI